MSAYFVSKQTIDFIVSGAIALELQVRLPISGHVVQVTPELGTIVGTMLWLENAKSLQARYSANQVDHAAVLAQVAGYEFEAWHIHRFESVLGCARSLDCQSCEHDGWATSEAARLLATMVDVLTGSVSDEQPWGIHNDEHAAQFAAKVGPALDLVALVVDYGRADRATRTPANDRDALPGFRPVTLRERLEHRAAQPLRGRDAGLPKGGLFDDAARNQLDLF